MTGTKSPTKSGLINLASPDKHISALQTKYPDLYMALKGFSGSIQSLVNEIYPPAPPPIYAWSFVIDNPSSGKSTDVLDYHHCIIQPVDPAGNWEYNWVTFYATTVTAKVAGTASATSFDIKVQTEGTTTWKSLYKPNFSPTLGVGELESHNVQFAVNSVFPYDVLRVDVVIADAHCANVEVILVGYWNLDQVGS